jgi:hypothetical protein
MDQLSGAELPLFFPLLARCCWSFFRTEQGVGFHLVLGLGELLLAARSCYSTPRYGGFQFLERWSGSGSGPVYNLGVEEHQHVMVCSPYPPAPVHPVLLDLLPHQVKVFHVCLLLMTSACAACSATWTWFSSTCSGRPCWSPCTCSSRSGAAPKRRYAPQVLLYTLAGVTLLWWHGWPCLAGRHLLIPELMAHTTALLQLWVFLAMGLAFANKVPCSRSKLAARGPRGGPPRRVGVPGLILLKWGPRVFALPIPLTPWRGVLTPS